MKKKCILFFCILTLIVSATACSSALPDDARITAAVEETAASATDMLINKVLNPSAGSARITMDCSLLYNGAPVEITLRDEEEGDAGALVLKGAQASTMCGTVQADGHTYRLQGYVVKQKEQDGTSTYGVYLYEEKDDTWTCESLKPADVTTGRRMIKHTITDLQAEDIAQGQVLLRGSVGIDELLSLAEGFGSETVIGDAGETVEEILHTLLQSLQEAPELTATYNALKGSLETVEIRADNRAVTDGDTRIESLRITLQYEDHDTPEVSVPENILQDARKEDFGMIYRRIIREIERMEMDE